MKSNQQIHDLVYKYIQTKNLLDYFMIGLADDKVVIYECKKDALAKSATFFADLRYSSYETMIKSVLSSRESVSIDKFKNILSSFKSISMTGNNNEAEFIIQFSEKKTNSLQRIMDLLTEAYRLVS